MPQIPGLPIDEAVEKPHASPAQFGSVGETIAGLGEETEQLAQGASEVEGHLIAAQRQLKAKQAEIGFDRLKMQVYTDLNKTTTPEEAQAVYDHSKGQLDSVIAPFETDRVLSRALGLYRQQQDVEIQGTVNAKKADIITKSDEAANQTLGVKALQEAVTTTVGGGSPSVAREKYSLQLQSSVSHGTLVPEKADQKMEQWDQKYEKGVIEAYSNSPNPAERKQLINQLKSSSTTPETTDFMVSTNPKGLVESGNLPIWNRPIVKNSDGSRSSEYSTSFDDNGVEVLVPTVVDGKFLTPDGKKPPDGSDAEKAMFDKAWQHYKDTGENLGKFKTPEDADAYAEKLHNRGERPTNTASKGSDGFPNLDAATKNALLTKAMSRDREITNLAESEDFNGAVNHFDGLTKGWTYEDKVKALESGDWLKNNGFVDGNGQPDRKKADMLLEESDRTEARQKRIQGEKDTEVISKYVDQADAGKISDPQIDLLVKQEGGSPKAASTLRSVLRQHITQARSDYRFGEYMANAGNRADNRNAKANGDKASAELFRKLDKGETIDPQTDIWDKVDAGDMTVAQARKLETARDAHKRADFKDNNARIVNAPGIDDQAKGKMQLELLDASTQQNLQGQNMRTFTDNLLKDHATKQTGNAIQNLWHSVFGGTAPTTGGAPVSPSPAAKTKPSGTVGTFTSGGKEYYYDSNHKNLGPVN